MARLREAIKERHDTKFWKAQRKVALASGWLLSFLFILACFSLCFFPQQTGEFLPHPKSSWLLSGVNSIKRTAAFVLPNTKAAAYDLGYLTRSMESDFITHDASTVNHAAKLLKLPAEEISAKLLKNVGEAIHDNDENGLGAKVRGLFSFVSVIWILASIGLATSILPVFKAASSSIAKLLIQRAPGVLVFIIDSVTILEPTAHASLFGLSFYIIAAAGRYPSGYNRFIALSGCLLSMPTFHWSTARITKKELRFFSKYSTFSIAMFSFLVLAPVAIAYDSALLGFLAVGAFFQAIGLCCAPFGLGWAIGFSNRLDLYQVAAASFVILQALIVSQVAGVDSKLLHLFHTGGQIFGSVGFFLAGLIETSKYFHRKKPYYSLNAAFFIVLFSFVLAGSVLNLASLQNTGLVFVFLWLVEKVMELSIHRAFWYTIFGGSIVLWQFAVWLHGHPEFVEAMFDAWDFAEPNLARIAGFCTLYENRPELFVIDYTCAYPERRIGKHKQLCVQLVSGQRNL